MENSIKLNTNTRTVELVGEHSIGNINNLLNGFEDKDEWLIKTPEVSNTPHPYDYLDK